MSRSRDIRNEKGFILLTRGEQESRSLRKASILTILLPFCFPPLVTKTDALIRTLREILPLATSSPRLSARVLCCNIVTYRQFQFEFISVHIVWAAYNHNAIRSYRQHRQKFRLDLSYPFFPNLVKLIFFDFHVCQYSGKSPSSFQKYQNPSNIHSHKISERSDSLDWESCEALLLEFGDDSL